MRSIEKFKRVSDVDDVSTSDTRRLVPARKYMDDVSIDYQCMSTRVERCVNSNQLVHADPSERF